MKTTELLRRLESLKVPNPHLYVEIGGKLYLVTGVEWCAGIRANKASIKVKQ